MTSFEYEVEDITVTISDDKARYLKTSINVNGLCKAHKTTRTGKPNNLPY